MGLRADIIFLFLSSVNNNLFTYLFIVVSMDREIEYIGTTELTNIPYVSVQWTYTTATTSYHQKMFQKISIFKETFLRCSCSAVMIKKF